MDLFLHCRLEKNPDLAIVGLELFDGVDVGDELTVDAEEFFIVQTGLELAQVLVYDKLMARMVFHKYDAVLGIEECNLIGSKRYELGTFFGNNAGWSRR